MLRQKAADIKRREIATASYIFKCISMYLICISRVDEKKLIIDVKNKDEIQIKRENIAIIEYYIYIYK